MVACHVTQFLAMQSRQLKQKQQEVSNQVSKMSSKHTFRSEAIATFNKVLAKDSKQDEKAEEKNDLSAPENLGAMSIEALRELASKQSHELTQLQEKLNPVAGSHSFSHPPSSATKESPTKRRSSHSFTQSSSSATKDSPPKRRDSWPPSEVRRPSR